MWPKLAGGRMKIGVIVARILLGLIFVFFGSNAFLNFLHPPSMPTGNAGQFIGALVASHYVMVVGAAQVVGGLLLLIGRFVPLGLTILGPVIVNILSYHLFLSPQGVGGAVLVALLWLFLFYAYRQNFATMFAAKAEPH
jgi:putative oxidoreductase